MPVPQAAASISRMAVSGAGDRQRLSLGASALE
jgi:hypothetical protein